MEAYQQLEREWAVFNGLEPDHMVCCSSGTAALHLALEAVGKDWPHKSKVILPDFCMIACARACTLADRKPYLVDCEDNLLLDPEKFDNNWVDSVDPANVKAILAVHTYGRQCRMKAIERIATYNDAMPVIEDMAEIHGVKPRKYSSAACWSFYRNKIVAGEEGGAVWFVNKEHADLARLLRCLGFTPEHDFHHIPRGHNYRLANSLASLILDSLKAYPANDRKRREIEQWYDSFCPAAWRMPPRDAVWVYDLRIPGLESEQQDQIVRALNEAGIPARHGFKRLSCQPEYRVPGLGFSNAARLSREVFYLPVQPGVTTKGQAERAFATIHRVLDQGSAAAVMPGGGG